jgi:hypothetical protein
MELKTCNTEWCMSEDDVLRAKDRVHQDYRECKERLGALENEARHLVALLEGVCAFLRGDNERFASGELEQVFTEKQTAMMSDLRAARARRKVLYKTLTDMGREPKE